ncbi:hypothetical protein T03_15543 [Trichinella britovi]|uniref:Uncharacterized protein n=1 Tax=Trichinella britovi TaxID=45882 RepID=A0A0V1CS50_TRIBR|nr:hypothetical protein T03_15543 [Trichinella britovi]
MKSADTHLNEHIIEIVCKFSISKNEFLYIRELFFQHAVLTGNLVLHITSDDRNWHVSSAHETNIFDQFVKNIRSSFWLVTRTRTTDYELAEVKRVSRLVFVSPQGMGCLLMGFFC